VNETLEETVARLVQVFEAIDLQRMQDMPLRNGQLNVESVGFHLYQDHLLGVLITPWFMNLVMLPLREKDKAELKAGHRTRWRFPGESVEFITSPLPKFGWIHSAALFSSVSGFPDQDAARDVATEALGRLLEPVEGKELSTESPARDTGEKQVKISRRDLFRGLLPRSD
jgi:[NiFe] hydrogenase assembly HybE family chaperone